MFWQLCTWVFFTVVFGQLIYSFNQVIKYVATVIGG